MQYLLIISIKIDTIIVIFISDSYFSIITMFIYKFD